MAVALEGIKVMDFCHLAPGMYCTMMLSDFGADVIRIDRPREVDTKITDINLSDSHVWSFERAMNLGNRFFNRNKKSIGLNLKSSEAKQIVYRMAETTDVIVEGFRPGVAKRLGIDYDTLSKINPTLIYCSLSGFGQDGPYVNIPGHDVTYIAIGGALDMVGQEDGPPVIPMNFLADWAGAALHGVIGILIALMAAKQTGRGQFIDIAYTDGVISLVSLFAYDFLNNGTKYPRGCTPFNGGYPGYNVYKTMDGKYIAIGCFEPWFWANLCRFIGRDDFVPDQYAEGERKKIISDYISNFFLEKTRDQWFEILKDLDIPTGKIHDLEEVFEDPQIKHRKLIHEFSLPDGQKERTIGATIKLSATPGTIKSPAPKIGNDTSEILHKLGYTKEHISQFQSQGIINTPED